MARDKAEEVSGAMKETLLRIHGLRKRWILNSVGPVIADTGAGGHCWLSAHRGQQLLQQRPLHAGGQGHAPAPTTSTLTVMSSYSEYYRNASLYAASFEDSSHASSCNFWITTAAWISPLGALTAGTDSRDPGGRTGAGERAASRAIQR